MTRMGRSVLPVSEQILFALNWLWRHCVNRAVKPYVPDFRQAFDHFCLHAGAQIAVRAASSRWILRHAGWSCTPCGPAWRPANNRTAHLWS